MHIFTCTEKVRTGHSLCILNTLLLKEKSDNVKNKSYIHCDSYEVLKYCFM